MNRIEAKMKELKEQNKKAFITYMTAGLPDMKGMKAVIRASEEAGLDVLELGIPFSDPVADGPVIQAASYKAICQGVNLKKILLAMESIRAEGIKLPIVFMMYYNTITHYGIKAFVESCVRAGVDGLIVPDLPFEEQGELQDAIAEVAQEQPQADTPILLQLVSPVSAGRIPMILEHARGFVYCVSSMGVTGQEADFHKEVIHYLQNVKSVSEIPVMMGFGIRTAADIAPMKDTIDGAIVGTHFIQLLEDNNYNPRVAADYIRTFKAEM